MRSTALFSVLFLTACVTINIYFPAAAAEKVADEIIKGIQSDGPVIEQNNKLELESKSKSGNFQLVVYSLLDQVLNIVIPMAQAAEADLSVDTAEIRQLRSAMHSRFASLKPFYTQGILGIKSDGYIVIRGSVPLKVRNKVNKLVAVENADRARLYQAIANANGHPEWKAQIQATFASRWVSNAQLGWDYQTSNGSWKKK